MPSNTHFTELLCVIVGAELDDVVGVPALKSAREIIELPAVCVRTLALEDLVVTGRPVARGRQGPRFHVASSAKLVR